MIIAILLAQTAPDIELTARVRAKSVAIERRGEASLTVSSQPAGNNLVDVTAPPSNGPARRHDVVVDLRAEARIADIRNGDETTTPK